MDRGGIRVRVPSTIHRGGGTVLGMFGKRLILSTARTYRFVSHFLRSNARSLRPWSSRHGPFTLPP